MSDSTMTAPTAAQLRAIAASGLGHPFRVFQPRNLASWVFVWYIVAGAIAAVRWFRPGFESLGTASVLGFVLFGLYTIPWVWYLRHIDRWTQIPGRLAVWAALWGACAAAFFVSLTANGAFLSIYNKAVSATFAQDWGPGFTAPFTEETSKGIGILLLLFIAPRIIRTPFDGFMVGAFVGLGFQIIEDILYVVNVAGAGFGGDQVGAAMQIFGLRGAVGLFSHTLFSAIYGTAMVFLVGTASTPARRGLGVVLILLAMVVHGVWDAAGALAGMTGLNPFFFMILMGIIELVIIRIVLHKASDTERHWVRDLLAPEVERGVISEAEVGALAGSRRERRRYLHALDGKQARQRGAHVLDATRDLVRALSQSGGYETPGVAFLRSEIDRVRSVT